jgi:hypothetical protein
MHPVTVSQPLFNYPAGVDKNSGLIAFALIAIIAVALLVVAGAGLHTTTVTVSSDEGLSEWTPPPADGSYGLVVGSHKAKDGLDLFGWDITPSTWEAQVMFVAPAGCEPGQEEEVVATGPCAGIPAEGTSSGGGTTEDGLPLLTVRFEVSKQCHESLAAGDHWPTLIEACR